MIYDEIKLITTSPKDSINTSSKHLIPKKLQTNLIAFYEFESGSGNVAIDSSPYGNNGSINNCIWTTDRCFGNYALYFNGVNAWVNINSVLDDFPEFKNRGAYDLFVKANSSIWALSNIKTFITINAESIPSEIGIFTDFRNGKNCLIYRFASGIGAQYIDLIYYYDPDYLGDWWCRLTMTWDVVADYVKAWFNGELVEEAHNLSVLENPTFAAIGHFPITIDYPGDYWKGTIDQVRIYKEPIDILEGFAKINHFTFPLDARINDIITITSYVRNLGANDTIITDIIDADTLETVGTEQNLFMESGTHHTFSWDLTMPNKTWNLLLRAGHEE